MLSVHSHMGRLAAYAWLQALGTDIAALGQTRLLNPSEAAQTQGNEMVLLGNAMQSIANAAQAKINLEQGDSPSDQLSALGNTLQSLGNAIQVVAGISTPGSPKTSRGSRGPVRGRGRP